jgi:alkylation response protein AidB-like acyl-CoA dehydrogenase
VIAADRPVGLPLDLGGERDRVRQTAADRFPAVPAHAGPARVDRALVARLAEAGLLPRLFPAARGGTADGEVSAATLCLLREALACESTAAETALAMQGLGAYPILQSGSAELARRGVGEVAAGRAVAAFALTEPQAGSDAAAIALRAEPDGDGWRLSGEKAWISNAPDADVYTVFARTTPEAGARGVTAFAVAGDAPGLSGEPVELVAPHPVGHLTFDGVRVGPGDLLGEVDRGFSVAMATLDLFRPSVGAFAVGMGQAALEAALSHTSERHAFGEPLRARQAVAHRLADMATRTQAARLLVYDAAAAHDSGQRIARQAAMAKVAATEAAQQTVDDAVQLHGAAGLARGHLLEHLYREVRAPRIYEGSSEVLRDVIARELP